MTSIYRNILVFLLLIFLFVFIAFFRSYFGLFPEFKNTDTIIHVHVAIILVWFGLLIAQPLLIRRKNFAAHKALGKVTYVVVPLVIISGFLMTRHEQLREKNILVFAANIIDLTLFASLYGLALYYRRKPQWHGRFMLLTILPFISPSAARLSLNGLAIELIIILLLLLLERFASRQYKPYLITLSTFVIVYLPITLVFITAPEAIDAIWRFFFL